MRARVSLLPVGQHFGLLRGRHMFAPTRNPLALRVVQAPTAYAVWQSPVSRTAAVVGGSKKSHDPAPKKPKKSSACSERESNSRPSDRFMFT